MNKIKRIGIFGNEYQADKQSAMVQLFDKLTAVGAEIYIDSEFYYSISSHLEQMPQINDLLTNDDFALDAALSLGGDGTFLRTAARVNKKGIPILGINMGRLGFLADVESSDIDSMIDNLFAGNYQIEERTLLHLHTDEHVYRGYNYALNEVAVLKRDTSSMITIHTFLGGEYLTSYQADGLTIATPTGSTGYSMSVGGPIIYPQSHSLVLSPVAPHSLNVRPLVIPDNFTITLKVESRSGYFLISLDGRSEIFPSGMQLQIKRADYTTKVIKRIGHTFYQTLREKLMWGADVRMK